MEILKASYYVYAKYHSTYSTPERITEFYEFEFCTSGEGYTVIDGVRYARKPGALVFSKPGQKRYAIGAFECYYIHFKLEASDAIKANIDSLPDWYMPADIKEISEIFTKVCDKQFGEKSNAEMFTIGAVMQLTSLLNEMIYPLGRPAVCKYERYFDEIIKAKTYMALNYGSKLSLKTVASLVNLSPNFFRIVFKEIVGISPHEYLIDFRIKKAEEYLTNTDFTISQIAEVCGFETQSYMNNVFASRIGETPYKFRKSNRKEM